MTAGSDGVLARGWWCRIDKEFDDQPNSPTCGEWGSEVECVILTLAEYERLKAAALCQCDVCLPTRKP